ncbi:class IV adenylate cyclase [Tuwongella immobilis]|uniref:CYTH domain-containing protein n=1 Tax=Tuwongella immobilis TaxID=692036 RepID=A0A6C2YM71_9BACT|nr:class IV adenylate cyclase [Tuwongella immobilis]VIP02457.1 Adenylyl cyclase related protein OS=Blastopirellula marina DSM 3645 GN=DSM3645_19438 PE=4 SV=1: CYTH [Tuwongella immobilis]VTS01456.1 Adenylyl cyclase related protein OS=Blastopirellula marina DSM 3645 GN=DSM3645_19438 PE=4 SV=1: CYTH [Tuwongella immobilis]
MFEIEGKYRVNDWKPIHATLHNLNAKTNGTHQEVDQYLNAPDRDFAQTGEAFRLRRIGADNFLTYKGPKRAAAVKMREEIEVPVAPGDDGASQILTLLQNLGYRPVFQVTKQRESFALEYAGYSVTICCDRVNNLGDFLEIEIVATEFSQPKVEQIIQELAERFDLGKPEPRSYLRMLLERNRDDA